MTKQPRKCAHCATGNVIPQCDTKEYPADRYIIQQAKKLDRAFCVDEVRGDYSVKYIRNRFMVLKRRKKIIPLPHTCPSYYLLREWRHLYPTVKNVMSNTIPIKLSQKRGGALEPRRIWSNFSAFLESLPPAELAHIHDVHLLFDAPQFSFVDRNWLWDAQAKCHYRRFPLRGGWSYAVKAYSTTRRVTVAVSCKFFYSISGLIRLVSLLGEVKATLGDVPEPMTWRVSMWHYGKDLSCTVRGRDFEVCFETFSGCLGRIYYKNNLAVVRFEEVQTPNKSVQEIFEKVLRDKCESEGS